MAAKNPTPSSSKRSPWAESGGHRVMHARRCAMLCASMKDTPGVTVPAAVRKRVYQSRSWRTGRAPGASPEARSLLQPRDEHLPQLVADQIDGEHDDVERGAQVLAHPDAPALHILNPAKDQAAKRRLGHRQPPPQKGQRRL